MSSGYQGWKNWETWSAALYLMNEEPLYRLALRYAKARTPFECVRQALGRMGISHNGDGVNWNSRKISRRELNAAIRELAS